MRTAMQRVLLHYAAMHNRLISCHQPIPCQGSEDWKVGMVNSCSNGAQERTPKSCVLSGFRISVRSRGITLW